MLGLLMMLSLQAVLVMIKIDINKAKEISHDMRRNKRAELFKPLDIEATVPALVANAEAQRQIIRDDFAIIQTKIDAAVTVDALKNILNAM